MPTRAAERQILRASWTIWAGAVALGLPVLSLALLVSVDSEVPRRARLGCALFAVVVLTGLVRWAMSYVAVSGGGVVVSGPLRKRRFSCDEVVEAHLTHGTWATPEVRLQGGRRLRISFLIENRGRQLVETLAVHAEPSLRR